MSVASLCPELESLTVAVPNDEEGSASVLLRDIFELDVSDKDEVVVLHERRPGGRLRQLTILNSDDLSDVHLRHVINRCPRLQHLRINNCPQVKGLFLQHPSLSVPLRSLNLSGCAFVNDQAMHALVASPSSETIEDLSLNFCGGISAKGFEHLGVLVGRKTLRTLQLRRVSLLRAAKVECSSFQKSVTTKVF